MTAPIPEEEEQHTLPTDEEPPGEHSGELPGSGDGDQPFSDEQEHNAETTEDQPSQ